MWVDPGRMGGGMTGAFMLGMFMSGLDCYVPADHVQQSLLLTTAHEMCEPDPMFSCIAV